jgi:hypothetical protein
MNSKCLSGWVALLVAMAQHGFGAEVIKAPVPVSPFIRVVYGYADAMLKHGRDKSGLLLSALDRTALTPLTNRPAAPQGVRPADRIGAATDAALAGSDPFHDENLLRLLSTLTDLSAKPHYRAAADAELKWFLESQKPAIQETFRPWLLWDRCFALGPDASKRFALQVSQPRDGTGMPRNARQAGFNIRALAVAYAQTKDEQFARALASWLEESRDNRSPEIALSLAIDCDGAAPRVPEPLASRLREVAAAQDGLFCALPHDVRTSGGFILGWPGNSIGPGSRVTSRWQARAGEKTTAQVGMMCVSRHDNSGKIAFRDLLLAAADAYLNSLPTEAEDAWPATFGQAISLELAAWRHSADWKYMERARQLGKVAVEKFWGTNALPRASLKTDHYESVTGADTLALALLELHLQILHITAVRCPANTLDR